MRTILIDRINPRKKRTEVLLGLPAELIHLFNEAYYIAKDQFI